MKKVGRLEEERNNDFFGPCWSSQGCLCHRTPGAAASSVGVQRASNSGVGPRSRRRNGPVSGAQTSRPPPRGPTAWPRVTPKQPLTPEAWGLERPGAQCCCCWAGRAVLAAAASWSPASPPAWPARSAVGGWPGGGTAGPPAVLALGPAAGTRIALTDRYLLVSIFIYMTSARLSDIGWCSSVETISLVSLHILFVEYSVSLPREMRERAPWPQTGYLLGAAPDAKWWTEKRMQLQLGILKGASPLPVPLHSPLLSDAVRREQIP